MNTRANQSTVLIEMNPPQFSLATRPEIAACVHGEHVVTDQQVTLFPCMVISHAPVQEESAQRLADPAAFVLCAGVVDFDMCRFKPRLGLRPWLVEAKAWLTGCRMINHQWESLENRSIEAARRD